MLPVARKPIVQYVAEELAANGIDQILFITGRGKASIENHFDDDPELSRALHQTNKTDILKEISLEDLGAQFFYTRQKVQRGLGDAILYGENFTTDHPFVVALGDSILGLHAQSQTVRQMVELFEKENASCVVAVEEVPIEETSHYGVVKVTGNGNFLRVSDMVEKPKPSEAPSNLAIAGRYVFSPRVFHMIRQVQPDAKGEIQLTDAIRRLCQEPQPVFAVKLPPGERRYDIGHFPSYFETFVEFALHDPLYGAEFRRYLERLVGEPKLVEQD